jgi:glycosyltransferase involved in cell wall biosynthesis
MQDSYHGIGRHTFELIQRLAPRDVELVVVHDSTRAGRLDVAGLARHNSVRLVDLPIPVVAPSAQLRWPALLAATRPDVLVVPYHLATPWLHPRVPTVAFVHDCIFESDSAYRPGGTFFNTAYRAATRVALARATAVATVSQATRVELQRHYGLGISADAVIPHGVGEQFLSLAQSSSDTPIPANLKTRYILHVGVHRPHKNHAVLLAAFAEVARVLPNVRLVLVGQADPRFPTLVRDLIRQYGVERRVDVLPHVGNDQLLDLYRNAAAFAFPSLVEGFGLPVLEAMAAGVPAVISDDPATAEAGAGACMVVPARDSRAWSAALIRVLTESPLAHDLIARGRQAALLSTWERAADRTLQLLQRVSQHNG